MIEQRTSVIEVGDEVIGTTGMRVRVTSVEVGEYGLLVIGRPPETEEDQRDAYVYVPYELAPGPKQAPWYAFARRGTLTLADGREVGYVGGEELFGLDGDFLSQLETKWKKTRDAMAREEMQHKPTSTRMSR